jgi:sec-independent protein translocase protein TatA
MFQLGPLQLLIILVIVIAIFGPSNLPRLGAMFGKFLRELKGLKEELPSKDDLKLDDAKRDAKRSSDRRP